MNLPLLSLLLLLMAASFPCQRLQNDFELEKLISTAVDDGDNLSDLGETQELNNTQTTTEENKSSEGKY